MFIPGLLLHSGYAASERGGVRGRRILEREGPGQVPASSVVMCALREMEICSFSVPTLYISACVSSFSLLFFFSFFFSSPGCNSFSVHILCSVTVHIVFLCVRFGWWRFYGDKVGFFPPCYLALFGSWE